MRRALGVRPWVVLALGLVLVCLGGVSVARRLRTTVPLIGVEWAQSSGGPLATRVDPGTPAERAGLLPGDILIRADGVAIESVLDAESLGWDPGFPEIALEVHRGGRPVSIALSPESRAVTPSLFAYLGLVGVGFLVSGGFIALRWPTVRGGLLYALLAAALFAEMTMSHTGRADLVDWTVFWVDLAAAAVAPALLLHLAVTVSRRALRAPRVLAVLAYVPAAVIGLAAAWLVAFRGAERSGAPVRAVEWLDRAEMFFLGVSVLLAIAILARSYRSTPSALHRSQARWMLWGLTLGLVPFVVLYALPWAFRAGIPTWADLSTLPILIVPAAFTAALVRYRLSDLDTWLKRGFAEVTAAFFTLAVYAVVVEVVRRGSGDLLPLSRSGARYVGILVAAVSYPKLRSWVHAWLDRAFYRSRYSYRATLLDWARELNAETDLRHLVAGLESRVRETLGVPDARVLVRSGASRFAAPASAPGDLRVDLGLPLLEPLEAGEHVAVEEGGLPEAPWARHLFGMRVKGRLRALLMVAERAETDGALSSEDRSLLATLAAHAAAAIESARLVHEVRQHAEEVERLKASQEQILESSGVGLFLIDPDERILAWNRTLEEMYGTPRESAVGRTIGEVFPLHAVRRMRRELAGLPADREARIYRFNLVGRTGRRLVVNLTISASGPSAGGEGGARVVTFDDVTEQVRLEEQVLRQERLASLGLLAAGVAHEVNTPLTGISSYTQMLLEEVPPGDPRREVLQKIEAQSRRASNIANSLLNLARPERAALEPLSLNEVVGEVLRLFEPQIREREIRVDLALGVDLPRVRGHKGKLQQVVLNLLLNARDAVEDGGRITVATLERGGKVAIEVTDDGCGIAEEDVSRIFDPFFTTKGRGKGTGLGLSISYGIVQEHGGDMQVESHPGEMTRFRVEIPADRREEALAAGP